MTRIGFKSSIKRINSFKLSNIFLLNTSNRFLNKFSSLNTADVIKYPTYTKRIDVCKSNALILVVFMFVNINLKVSYLILSSCVFIISLIFCWLYASL